uniref:GAG-pre-integrase domain-containing protein n=2 Tax=Nicotiana TaxID=4085 RepID=A0A1S4DM47_TOBAC|nr:PREDICTED: uncharacterized protein LOC104233667 [Nicotiana sylvestris]XP_016514486.1 PREDICTED: uncharacterized protein LOC107831248 [Nicotiana tabacum]
MVVDMPMVGVPEDATTMATKEVIPLLLPLCFQPTHTARNCPSLGSKALFSDLQSSSSAHSYTPPSSPQWYVDTGASSHMTPTTSNLSSIQPYNGNDSVMVGNGNQLPISYTGNGNFSTHSFTFSLKNILVVPTLSCNLLSVRKFTSDNNCSIDFDAFGFSIKDYKTKRILLRCNSLGPLYSFSPSTPGIAAHQAFVVSYASPTLWHRRLGHPSLAVLSNLVRSNNLQCSLAKAIGFSL